MVGSVQTASPYRQPIDTPSLPPYLKLHRGGDVAHEGGQRQTRRREAQHPALDAVDDQHAVQDSQSHMAGGTHVADGRGAPCHACFLRLQLQHIQPTYTALSGLRISCEKYLTNRCLVCNIHHRGERGDVIHEKCT